MLQLSQAPFLFLYRGLMATNFVLKIWTKKMCTHHFGLKHLFPTFWTKKCVPNLWLTTNERMNEGRTDGRRTDNKFKGVKCEGVLFACVHYVCMCDNHTAWHIDKKNSPERSPSVLRPLVALFASGFLSSLERR